MASDGRSDPARAYLDVMCGALARVLRMAGWDAAYALDRGVEADDEILRQATDEERVLLTRDRELAERAPTSVLLTETSVDGQVAELRDAGYPVELDEPTRCATCNGRLAAVPATDATPDYAPDPGDASVWRCRDCGQYYWRGSHWDDVSNRLA